MPAATLLLGGVTAVAIRGRGLLIEGEPGSGKSSLALALIDRGAVLIGDDGVRVSSVNGTLMVHPPPRTAGLLEVRNVGLIELPIADAPVALLLRLDGDAERYPAQRRRVSMLGLHVPVLPFRPGDAVQALRAEWALEVHGLA